MSLFFWAFSLLNYLIVFGSLFYLLHVRPTFKMLAITLLANTMLAMSVFYFTPAQWIALVLSTLFSGGFFYCLTKQGIAFFHSLIIVLLVIPVEYASLLLVDAFQLSTITHALLILIFFVITLYMYKKLIHKIAVVPLKIQLLLITMAIITFIIFYVTVFVGNITLSLFQFSLLLCYSIFLFMTINIVLKVVVKEMGLTQKELAQQSFYEYTLQLEQMNREIRQVQHDYSNILLAIRGYIEKEDVEGLRNYFEKVTTTTQSPAIHSLQQLENIQLLELKGLLSAKIFKAHHLSIAVNIEIPNTIEHLFIESIDLVRLIGIFFDNAMEATIQHATPKIELAILTISENEQLLIIRNTTNRNYSDITEIFKENYSTKSNNQGLGLYNVQQILRHYPNITLNTYVEDGWFVQEMMIEREEENARRDM